MPDRSKLHHFVPQLLLRGFAGHRERLITFDRTTSRTFPQPVGQAAAANDYNTVETPEGPSDLAEQLIANEIEGRASEGIRRLRDGLWLERDVDHLAVATLMAFQYLRVPAQREMADQMATSLMKLQVAAGGPRAIREALEANGQACTDEEVDAIWQGMTAFDAWNLKLTSAHHVQSSLEMLEVCAKALRFGFHWSVARWERRALLTSDHPVVLVRGEDHAAWSGVGLMTAGSILMAVDRHTALVLTNRGDLEVRGAGDAPDGAVLKGTFSMARGINAGAALQAGRFVFHHPDDDLDDLVGPQGRPGPPSPHLIDPHTGRDMRDKLVQMSNWHAANPDQPHPMAAMPPLPMPTPPPGARPVRGVGVDGRNDRQASVERRVGESTAD